MIGFDAVPGTGRDMSTAETEKGGCPRRVEEACRERQKECDEEMAVQTAEEAALYACHHPLYLLSAVLGLSYVICLGTM